MKLCLGCGRPLTWGPRHPSSSFRGGGEGSEICFAWSRLARLGFRRSGESRCTAGLNVATVSHKDRRRVS
jgi:hypothetical protein